MSTRVHTVTSVATQLGLDDKAVLEHIGSGVFVSTVKDNVRLLDTDECAWALDMFTHFRKQYSEKDAIYKVVELRADLLGEGSYFSGIDTIRSLNQQSVSVQMPRQYPAWVVALLLVTIVCITLLVSFPT